MTLWLIGTYDFDQSTTPDVVRISKLSNILRAIGRRSGEGERVKEIANQESYFVYLSSSPTRARTIDVFETVCSLRNNLELPHIPLCTARTADSNQRKYPELRIHIHGVCLPTRPDTVCNVATAHHQRTLLRSTTPSPSMSPPFLNSGLHRLNRSRATAAAPMAVEIWLKHRLKAGVVASRQHSGAS